jgi:hypothetical protein
MIFAEVIYTNCKNEYGFYEVYDYTPIIEALGYPLVRVDEDGYQGSTHVLLRSKENEDLFGYLTFGWGSCSGCDELQACNSYAELQELIDRFENDVKWDTAPNLYKYFLTHDWNGDWVGHDLTFQEFRTQSERLLRQETLSLLSGHITELAGRDALSLKEIRELEAIEAALIASCN